MAKREGQYNAVPAHGITKELMRQYDMGARIRQVKLFNEWRIGWITGLCQMIKPYWWTVEIWDGRKKIEIRCSASYLRKVPGFPDKSSEW